MNPFPNFIKIQCLESMSSLPGMFTNKTVVFSCESISDGVSDPETRSRRMRIALIRKSLATCMSGASCKTIHVRIVLQSVFMYFDITFLRS